MASISEIAAMVGFNVEDEAEFDTEKFRVHLNKTYTPTETILKDENIRRKVVGKVLGSLATKAAQAFELKSGEVDGKPLEEIFSLVKTKYNGIIAELSNQSPEQLTGRVNELELLVQQKDEQIINLGNQHTAEALQWEENLKAYKLSDKLSRVHTCLRDSLTDEYHKNDLVKTGFDVYIEKTYAFELNDRDELIVKDRTSGSHIQSKINAGLIASPEEVLQQAAETKGVLKKNRALPQSAGTIKQQMAKTNLAEREIKIHPNALKHAQAKSRPA